MTDPLDVAARELAADVARRYRVSQEDAVSAIKELWSRRPNLVAAGGQVADAAALKRTRVYRDAADAAKREIYHRLRRYRRDAADQALSALSLLPAGAPAADRTAAAHAVAAAHVSTAERLDHLGDFFGKLVELAGVPETVVDVGAGVLPLVVPFDGPLAGIRQYWSLEKDASAVGAVAEYARLRADDRVHPMAWDLADGWPAAHSRGLPERCELGLLLKVVPVVARQAPGLVEVLARTPADRLVVSGSRVAMAKRQDIERREARLLQRFFADHGLRVVARLRTEDELAFLVERS